MDDEIGFQLQKPPKKGVNFSQSVTDLRGGNDDAASTVGKYKRKASLFPTAVDIPVERGFDKYGRKQSVMELTKKVYNLPKSNLIKNAAVPLSTRRLSVAVKGVLHSEQRHGSA